MNNTQVVLSNGDTVTVRPFCSRRVYKEIQKKTWANNPEVAAKMDNMKFNILDMADAEDYAMFAMIEKIVDKNGTVKTIEEAYVLDLPIADFNVLKAMVQAITNPENDNKDSSAKKG